MWPMGHISHGFPLRLSLHWRHNDHDSVSNHQPHGCLLNRLFRRRSKKTSKLRVTGLCVGNSPGPVYSPHKGPFTPKIFPFDDVIMPCIPWMNNNKLLTGLATENNFDSLTYLNLRSSNLSNSPGFLSLCVLVVIMSRVLFGAFPATQFTATTRWRLHLLDHIFTAACVETVEQSMFAEARAEFSYRLAYHKAIMSYIIKKKYDSVLIRVVVPEMAHSIVKWLL